MTLLCDKRDGLRGNSAARPARLMRTNSRVFSLNLMIRARETDC